MTTFRLRAIVPKRAAPFDAQQLKARATHEMRSWGQRVMRRMVIYPRQVFGAPMRFVSDRQRRGFFYHLRKGHIRVPYRRTGTLGRSWSERLTMTGLRIIERVGANHNIAPYAPHVEGPANGPKGLHQAAHMRLHNWQRIDEEAQKEWKRTSAALRALFRGR